MIRLLLLTGRVLLLLFYVLVTIFWIVTWIPLKILGIIGNLLAYILNVPQRSLYDVTGSLLDRATRESES